MEGRAGAQAKMCAAGYVEVLYFRKKGRAGWVSRWGIRRPRAWQRTAATASTGVPSQMRGPKYGNVTRQAVHRKKEGQEAFIP